MPLPNFPFPCRGKEPGFGFDYTVFSVGIQGLEGYFVYSREAMSQAAVFARGFDWK